MEKLRIGYDELDENNIHEVEIYQGRLFTGILYENFESGEIRSETEYLHGYRHGWSREWYQNGQLKEEDFSVRTTLDGRSREWYENGQLKQEKQVEQAIVVSSKEWDEQGKLIKEFEIDETHSLYNLLQQRLKNRRSWLSGVKHWEENPPRAEDFSDD